MLNNDTNNSKEKLVISAACLGMFLSTLDSGVINVALPEFQQYFHAPISTISWTISLYMIVLSSTIITFGRASDRYGRIKIFSIGLIIFAISSLLCGMSKNISFFIFSRGLQGVGAAMIQATAAALITTIIPEERRGPALGTLAVVMGIGPIFGPTVSGLFISTIGWRWIFIFNLPLCLFGLVLCSRLNERFKKAPIKIDVFATFVLSMVMLAFMLLIHLLTITTNALPYELSIGFIIILLIMHFIKQQKRSKNPIIPFELLRDLPFSNALFSTLAFGLTTAMLLVLPPLFLTISGHFKPWQIGFLSLFGPLGLIFTARFSGKHISVFGVNNLMLIGLAIMMISLAGLQAINQLWNPLWFIPLLCLYGVGGGLFQPANIAGIMSAVGRERQGTMGAVNRMIHNFGNALGVAISALFLQIFSLGGCRYAWLFSLCLIFIAFANFVVLGLKYRLKQAEI